jgi:Delta 1-pyrroline-5-carboxylate dehydrogenase
LQREGGKTLDDALSEVREAIDFCRYYAAEGREAFGDGKAMPGPTGESKRSPCAAAACSSRSRRGIFRWRSSGPGHGALMAGNAVVAKPAEQTPLIAR